MTHLRLHGTRSLFSVPLVVLLLLAVACGSAAAPTVAPQTVAPTQAVQASPSPTPTSPAAPPAATSGDGTNTQSTDSSGLASFNISQPTIDPDRSRQPEGNLTLAYHTALSPKWLDPQVAPASRTPYSAFIDNVFDPVIGAYPEGVFTYALGEHFEMTDDFKSATIRLREDIFFHNGEPVTSEDVKFTYENYSGANADVFQKMTDRVEIIDERTITFHFKEPFVDFLVLYGSTASGAGYIVPKDYYQEVGPEGFIKEPIGAGPYKVVGQTAGQEVVMEAFEDYWRQVPHIKRFVTKGVPEVATRVAALMTGDVDVAYFVTGALLQDAIDNPKIQIDPNHSAPFWLFFPGWEEPDSPFHDKRVREAVSLALDRQFLSDTETAGLALPTGNFIPPLKPGRIERPVPEHNPEKARQLMAEAGYPNGFQLDNFTPFPPVFSLGERILDSLRDIGIKGEVNVTQRPVFLSMLREGREGFPGVHMGFAISTGPPDAAAYFRAFAACDGDSSVICDPKIDELLAQYDASLDLEERAELAAEMQNYILDEFIFVPVYINSFAMGGGSRIDGDIADYSQVTPSLHPMDAVKLKQ